MLRGAHGLRALDRVHSFLQSGETRAHVPVSE